MLFLSTMMKLAKFSLTLAIILIFTNVKGSVGRVVSIRKCCEQNDVIDVSLMKCRSSGQKKWSPSYFSDTNNEHGDSDAAQGISRYEITSKIPECPGTGVHIIPLRDLDAHSIQAARFRLLASGKIVAKHANGHWITVPLDSCIDGLQNFDDSGDLYTGNELDQALITCPLTEEDVSIF